MRQSSASVLDCVFIAPWFSKQRGAHNRPTLRDGEGGLQEALSVPFKPVQYRGIVGHKRSGRPVLCITPMVSLVFCPNVQKGLLLLQPKIPDPVEDIPAYGTGVGLGDFKRSLPAQTILQSQVSGQYLLGHWHTQRIC